ncbi:general secretion pathway protein J [Natronospira proteinivora]|uniref:Type II secretion system protein J n=1 Tax=Natronospira proteinivora TaxID=1807133 RepID=A0ABT1G6E3_9GAMM|nr:type II secretion system minor pseudopilin GspJ [Natronospira proteinivora]MCP1726874.1 general secretion pathway protein J [Natronospira proteinivora]
MMRRRNPSRQRGFTLFELMVAIAVFSILGVMTWTAMAGMMRQQELTSSAMDRFRDIQHGMTLLSRDLEHIRPRPIRGASHGDFMPALRGGNHLEMPLEFTRGGVRNPLEQPRSTLQRVAYRLEGETLIRYSWQALDRAPDSQPTAMPLMDDVVSMELRFLGPQGEWSEDWPPVDRGQMGGDPYLMPQAVEVRLETDDMGVLRRLVTVPGVQGAAEREDDLR